MRLRVAFAFALTAVACTGLEQLTGGQPDASQPDASVDGPPISEERDVSQPDAFVLLDATPDGDAAGDTSTDAPVTDAGALPGPTMVRVGGSVGGFWIDSTEVTNAQYAAFLATNPSPAQVSLPNICAFHQGYFIGDGGVPASDNLPIERVTFCQAYGYCKWAGKRLCGQIGGGAVAPADYADPAKSQWSYACTQAGASAYPYGAVFQAGLCVTYDSVPRPTGPAPVGSSAYCRGSSPPFSQIYDLSGNVEEWEDNCDTVICTTRGGSYGLNGTYSACAGQAQRYPNMKFGFRCCKD